MTLQELKQRLSLLDDDERFQILKLIKEYNLANPDNRVKDRADALSR